MGPVHNKGLQDGIPQAHKPHTPKFNKDQQVLIEQEVQKRGSGSIEEGTPGRFCVHPVSSTQERWQSETNHQSQMPEFICGVPTLQNGRYSDVQEPHETRGLVSESGSKGCLLLSPDPSGPLEIPVFHSRRENVSVHMPPVRPDLSTLGLTKTLKPIAALGREFGFRLVIYIDDILLMAESKEMAQEQGTSLINLLQCLGFTINLEKTTTTPTQSIEFLGFNVKTLSMELPSPSSYNPE